MAVLSNTDLSKYRDLPFGLGKGFRWETFLYYLQHNKPFVCSPEGKQRFGVDQIVLNSSPELEATIKRAIKSQDFSSLSGIRFQSTNGGQTVKLSDLEKTEEFGKSGGNSGGSIQTAIIEAAQCIVCGALSLGHQIAGIESVPQGAYSVPNSDYVWSEFKKLSEEWQQSTVETAKAILNYVGEGKWTFHYGDRLVQSIIQKFNELKKGHFSGRKDKWNPADIWISSGEVSVNGFTDFQKFSDYCFSDSLKGISLKKGGTSVKECPDRSAKFSVENYEIKDMSEKAQYLLITFTLEGSENQKELYIRPDRDILKCEIKTKGSSHRNGSCGQSVLSQVLSDLGMREVNLHKEISKLEHEQKQDRVNHPGDYDEDLVRSAESSGIEPSLSDSEYKEYFKFNPEEIRSYAVKTLLQEISDFLKTGDDIAKTFISRIMKYCVSSLDNSCTYLKVS